MSDRTDHPLERLVFFSDAVFAIAITLLVIDVHAPVLPRNANDAAYGAALVQVIPNFIGFLLSFLVIGMFWMGHHRAFSLARRHHPALVPWSLALLGAIAFMPFVTAFLSEHPGRRVPAIAYWGWMILAAAFNMRVNRMATSPPVVAPDADPDAIAYIRIRSVSALIGAILSFALAFVAPIYAPAGIAVTGLVRRRVTAWRVRKARQRAAMA